MLIENLIIIAIVSSMYIIFAIKVIVRQPTITFAGSGIR